MKAKLKIKEVIGKAIWKAENGTVHLILRAFGTVVNYVIRKQQHTCISPDGHYFISGSQNGLIYLMIFPSYDFWPTVISFNVANGASCSAVFSKDMQRIIITYCGDTTTLSAVPCEGFRRRQVLIAEPSCFCSEYVATKNIVEYIWQTSSAYWKHTTCSRTQRRLICTLPNGAPWESVPPDNFDWDNWISHGERFWDRTCGTAISRWE